jgi:hypothetical protein
LKEEWIDNMVAKNKSFILKDFEISDSIETLQWARKRWALNKENPTGKSLVFTLQGVDEVKELTVKLHYDIYDHIPVIRKWMEIFNNGDQPQNCGGEDTREEALCFCLEQKEGDGDGEQNQPEDK